MLLLRALWLLSRCLWLLWALRLLGLLGTALAWRLWLLWTLRLLCMVAHRTAVLAVGVAVALGSLVGRVLLPLAALSVGSGGLCGLCGCAGGGTGLTAGVAVAMAGLLLLAAVETREAVLLHKIHGARRFHGGFVKRGGLFAAAVHAHHLEGALVADGHEVGCEVLVG